MPAYAAVIERQKATEMNGSFGRDGASRGARFGSPEEQLDAVLAAWQASPDELRLRPPLDEDGLLAAEARLDRSLPMALRWLYERTNGAEVFSGCLTIEPALVAADFAEELRDSDWPIAQEVLVFGGDGSDEHFGLWYPSDASPGDATPVVEIGEMFEPGCMAIVGSSLPAFLRTRTAELLVSVGGATGSMDALGMPVALRNLPRNVRSTPFVEWSDRRLPHHEPDPYLQRLDPGAVRRLVAALRD